MVYRRISNPWRDSERIQREMERMQRHLFRDFGLSRYDSHPYFPAVNVYANDQAQVITAELPGLKREDIEINVAGEALTISGSREPEKLEEGAEYHRQERLHGKFSRSFQLLFPVDADKVEASFDDGVLRVRLPRAESDRPRKITIK